MANFQTIISIKLLIFKNSKEIFLNLFSHMLWSSAENFSYFGLKLVDMNRFASDVFKFHFYAEIYEKSYTIIFLPLTPPISQWSMKVYITSGFKQFKMIISDWLCPNLLRIIWETNVLYGIILIAYLICE